MLVHLAKLNDFKLGLKEIGYSAVAIYGLSTLLKDTALEILNFFPPHRLGRGSGRGDALRAVFRLAGESLFQQTLTAQAGP
jgi:hypothetical protein